MIITKERIIELLEEVVEETGEDFVYRNPSGQTRREVMEEKGVSDSLAVSYSCYYVHSSPAGDEPGCIAGRVFHKLGVSLAFMRMNERISASAMADRAFMSLDQEARHVLCKAQKIQDFGFTYGEALWAAQNPGWTALDTVLI